jgi:hypothetical protein
MTLNEIISTNNQNVHLNHQEIKLNLERRADD